MCMGPALGLVLGAVCGPFGPILSVVTLGEDLHLGPNKAYC